MKLIDKISELDNMLFLVRAQIQGIEDTQRRLEEANEFSCAITDTVTLTLGHLIMLKKQIKDEQRNSINQACTRALNNQRDDLIEALIALEDKQ